MHAHDHAPNADYFLDQICTVIASGLLAVVCVAMYVRGMLGIILVEMFHIPVLIGGVSLLVLCGVRAVTLWNEVGRLNNAHHHGHVDCGHDHHHDCGHDHHDHSHGWTPAKYAVLLLPVSLFFLNLPNESFSAEYLQRLGSGGAKLEESSGPIVVKGPKTLQFRELVEAAYFPDARDYWEGRSGKLIGMFMPIRDKEFTLFRLKMTCCAADMQSLEMRIIAPEPVKGFTSKDWVEVEGVVQFRKLAGKDKYLPVLVLQTPDGLRKSEKTFSEVDL